MESSHPIRSFFAQAVHEAVAERLRIAESEDVVPYLADMLTEFLHVDAVFGIRDLDGKPVKSVAEMALEGDVRFNADSFERERQVHKHIGDYLLFWSGLYPEQFEKMRAANAADLLINPVEQGRASYHIASTFTYPPHDRQAKTLAKLSERFDAYQAGLALVRGTMTAN